jgi:hypothetical protein
MCEVPNSMNSVEDPEPPPEASPALNDLLCAIYEYADKSPELNMNNVDMEDVSELNGAMVEIYLLLCSKGIDKLYADREKGI